MAKKFESISILPALSGSFCLFAFVDWELCGALCAICLLPASQDTKRCELNKTYLHSRFAVGLSSFAGVEMEEEFIPEIRDLCERRV